MSCDTGIGLYKAWSALLDQRRPKASKLDISLAKRAYLEHREGCERCKTLTPSTLSGAGPSPIRMGEGNKEKL